MHPAITHSFLHATRPAFPLPVLFHQFYGFFSLHSLNSKVLIPSVSNNCNSFSPCQKHHLSCMISSDGDFSSQKTSDSFFGHIFLPSFSSYSIVPHRDGICVCIHKSQARSDFFVWPHVAFSALSLTIKIQCILFFSISWFIYLFPSHYHFLLLEIAVNLACLWGDSREKKEQSKVWVVLQWFLGKNNVLS